MVPLPGRSSRNPDRKQPTCSNPRESVVGLSTHKHTDDCDRAAKERRSIRLRISCKFRRQSLSGRRQIVGGSLETITLGCAAAGDRRPREIIPGRKVTVTVSCEQAAARH